MRIGALAEIILIILNFILSCCGHPHLPIAVLLPTENEMGIGALAEIRSAVTFNSFELK